MQCVMWLVLAAAVGAAALINHEMRLRHRVVLDAPRALGQLRIALPRGWIRGSEGEGDVLAHLSEPGEGLGRRQLLILSISTEGFIPPLTCLERLNGRIGRPPEEQIQRLQMGGYPGVLVSRRMRRAGGVEAGVVQACVSFPWRQAIVIHLEGLAGEEEGDLVQRIAASISLPGRPAPVQGSTLIFPRMKAPVPAGWRITDDGDPNRVARQLIDDRAESWLSAEVIPCYVPDRHPGAIGALVAANQGDWLDARISGGGGQWRLQLQGARSDSLVEARVLAGAKGRGVIVIFRGSRSDLPRVEAAWRSITEGIVFEPAEDWAQLLSAGARAVEHWAQTPPDQLLELREDQWWLWYGQGANSYEGWINLQWLNAADEEGGAPWRAVWEMRRREEEGSVERVQQKVEGALGAYVSHMERWRSTEAGDRFIPIGGQTTRVRDGGLSQSTVSRRMDGPAPAQFVGGGWLPLLMGQGEDRAMVLKTESLLFQQSPGVVLDVIVRPEAGGAATRASGAEGAGRRLVVQVNGSGDLSRWSFGADGELRKIECARGLQLLPAGPQDLRLDFHDDARLLP